MRNKEHLELKVEKSSIGIGGRARVRTSVFDELGLSDGDPLTVAFEDKGIVVEGYSDDLIKEGYIRLRRKDIERLDIYEDDIVKILPYTKTGKKVSKIIKRKMKKLKR